MKSLSRFFILVCVLAQTACMSTIAKRDPAYAAVRPVAIPVPERNDGTIYNPSNNISLFEDYRARRPGDILTVQLQEQTDAEKETETTISKNNNNSIPSFSEHE